MLELLHEFANDEFEATPERDEIRHRHAVHFAQLVARYEDARWGEAAGYWIDAASTLRMDDKAVIILDPVNRPVIEAGLKRGLRDYVGGRGVAHRHLWEEMDPRTGPLPPANTLSDRRIRRSSGSSNWYDQSIAARSVRW